MAEDWVDCPSLGPGWQRREVFRKSGIRHGQSDTYYISPRGEKIRSRVELLRLLGCSRDLTDFDYKKGIFVEPNAEPLPSPPLSPTEGSLQKQIRRGGKKRHPSSQAPLAAATHPHHPSSQAPLAAATHPHHPSSQAPLAAATHPPKKPPDKQVFAEPRPSPGQEFLDQRPLKLELEMPVETPANIQSQQPELLVNADQLAPKPLKRRYQKHILAIPSPGKMEDMTLEESNPKEAIACCASCQGQFPEVMLPSQRRCRWLCPDCRAQRRAFNREQRYYKQIGCGVCQACQMSHDCGICSVCVLRAKSPELHIGVKCLLRRCLKIVKKGPECGLCQACKITEDCGTCVICLRRQKPGMKRQWKCLRRRCHRRKKKIPPKKDSCSSKKHIVEAASPKQRGQKKPALTTEGSLPKGQWASKRHHKRLSAIPVVPTDGPLLKAQLAPGHHNRRHSATTKKQLGVAKERKKVGRPPKHPAAKLKNSVHPSKSRQNRKCGECEACLLKMDCGYCDFCCDKPKFGGQNLKRQKCRWRQCLQFAMKRLLPEEWSSPEAEGAAAAGRKVRRRRNAFGGFSRKPARIKQVGRQGAKGHGLKKPAKASFQPEESSSTSELTELPKSHGLGLKQEKGELQPQPLKQKKEPEKTTSTVSQEHVKDFPILLPQDKKEQDVPHHPTSPSWVIGKDPDTKLPAVSLLIAASPKIKQELTEPGGDCQPSSDSPVSAGLPQFKRPRGIPQSEVMVLDDSEDSEMEQLQQVRPPVIMEIYSLGGMQPLTQLDSVLQEFLAELNEIPLPAHWEVLPPLGSPDLRLVQRSKHSTMSAAVIHIRPGLFFHVVVQDLPVPPEHKLYASHPARLTTVDEVVELIGDLEAYRLCSGRPAGWHAGERSEACSVLVYSGCCPQCRLNPWPSGSGTH